MFLDHDKHILGKTTQIYYPVSMTTYVMFYYSNICLYTCITGYLATQPLKLEKINRDKQTLIILNNWNPLMYNIIMHTFNII